MADLTSPTGLTAGLQPGNPPPDIDASGLGGTPSLPSTDVRSPQVLPAPGPDAVAKHTIGRAVGSIFGGLQPTQTSYSIDPATGKTISTTSKTPPGQWARGIVAAGLLGAGGIGPEHGEHTFAQGLLSGLTGGAQAMSAQRGEQDAKAKEQAQQDYANQLKAKELSQKELMNNAAIANYTQDTLMKKYQIMKYAADDSEHGAQLAVATDVPILKIMQDANNAPIKTDLNAADFKKDLADNTNAINAHSVIPIVTGYQAVKHTDGSTSYEPIGNLYSSTVTVGPELPKQILAAGYDKDSAIYKNALDSVGKKIEPQRLVTYFNAINQGMNLQEQSQKIAADNAAIARDRATEAAEYERYRGLKMDNDQKQSYNSGQTLFNTAIKPDGSLDLNSLNGKTPAETAQNRKDMDMYLQAQYETGVKDYDTLSQAHQRDPEDKSIADNLTQQGTAVSTYNSWLNSLRGTHDPKGTQPSDLTNRLTNIAQAHTQGLISKNSLDLYNSAVQEINSGTPLSSVLEEIGKVKTLPPQELLNLTNNINAYGKEAIPIRDKNTDDIKTTQQVIQQQSAEAWNKEHPFQTAIQNAGNALVRPSLLPSELGIQ